jgi:hypothetical protein
MVNEILLRAIDTGVSRGTISSLRPSFKATSAARSTRFEENPTETRAIVPMLHGHRMAPPTSAVPEEGGASMASERKTRTLEARSAPIQPGSASFSSSPCTPGSTPSSCRMTLAAASVMATSTSWPQSTSALSSASA